MGQVIFKDKIGTLSQSVGNITMAASVSSPAYLTIGGQQYTITSNLSVSVPVTVANQRYQIFAIQSGGVVSLVTSTNENSVGPSGYSGWKLVGSFYTNGNPSIAFGAFVSITGTPKTSWIPSGVVNLTASTSAPTKATVKDIDETWWMLDGDHVRVRMDYRAASATGSAIGSGDYLWGMPTNLVIDLTTITTFSTPQAAGFSPIMNSVVGEFTGGQSSGATGLSGVGIAVWDSTHFVCGENAHAGTSNGGGIIASAERPLTTNGWQAHLRIFVPLSGGLNTPIQDR